MASIVSVSNTQHSAEWHDEHARDVVLAGLRNDGYIVLTVDDSTSLSAQVCGHALHACCIVRVRCITDHIWL